MGVLTLGLNHTTAPLDVRGRFAFAPHQLQDPLRALTSRLSRAAPEAALLSTCNRTELYLAADAHEVGALMLPATEWLAAQGGVSVSQLGGYTYTAENRAAARHAFRVAAGLDSMVLGEPQILGQMKEAEKLAPTNAGGLGLMLNQLVSAHLRGRQGGSLDHRYRHAVGFAWLPLPCALASQDFRRAAPNSACAVRWRRRDDRSRPRRTSPRSEPKSITVANRTLDRAESLATRLRRKADEALADLPDAMLHKFDIVVSCTASFAADHRAWHAVERALIRARRHKPMFIVDLAVPRDVEPEVARSSTTSTCYTVDDLGKASRRPPVNDTRQAAVAQAEAIIESPACASFEEWIDGCAARCRLIQDAAQAVPTRCARNASCSARTQAAGAQRRVNPKDVIDASCRTRLTNKMLHCTYAELNAVAEQHRARR